MDSGARSAASKHIKPNPLAGLGKRPPRLPPRGRGRSNIRCGQFGRPFSLRETAMRGLRAAIEQIRDHWSRSKPKAEIIK